MSSLLIRVVNYAENDFGPSLSLYFRSASNRVGTAAVRLCGLPYVLPVRFFHDEENGETLPPRGPPPTTHPSLQNSEEKEGKRNDDVSSVVKTELRVALLTLAVQFASIPIVGCASHETV
ncbi:hypothetical protein OUZ56_031974 [Daphnia magna]|uniref:Uncharacterized protein n=1 Tax=Daphnia magna TaxID=35525 RepID=A0ABQ9ZVR9_9CRUS|nr:hypothetical protein OUZ56_031974 [Daphnia magna]